MSSGNIIIQFYIKMISKYGIDSLKSREQCEQLVENAQLIIMDGGTFNKVEANKFLDEIHEILDKKSNPADIKVFAIHVVKELNYYFDSKLIGVLLSHKLFEFMVKEVQKTDLKKRLKEKGANKFPESKQMGIQYIRIILECLTFWSEKYARGSGDRPSKFKRVVSEFKSKGVDLPTSYMYLDKARIKSRSSRSRPGQSSSALAASTSQKPKPISTPQEHSNISGDIAFSKDKICLFIGTLEDEDDEETLRKQIQNNHKNFSEDLKKYELRQNQIQKPENEGIIELYFKVNHFLNEQSVIYTNYVTKNDYASYLTEIKKVYEELAFQSPQTDSRPITKPKLESAEPTFAERSEPTKYTVKKITQQKQASGNPISNIFLRLQERSRSKSPNVGFKQINKQLEKQKESIRRNPLRRTSRSPITNRSASVSRSATAIGSKISHIFNNPPNRYPAPKTYEGQTVQQNRELSKVIFSIKKQQGARRFKVSNLRQKNPLFQNGHIQVGYKSHVLYENISGFSQFICLNIFIGNKTESVIKNFKIEYKADNNQLLYANPKVIDSLVPPGYQNKHDLMISPLKIPYCFMTMNISYSIDHSNIATSIVLPNSVLKFASYMTSNQREFQRNWMTSEKLKTLPFQLCKFFSPDSLKKWIPALQYGTDYKKFSEQGSETDLELYCEVIILQKYEGVLKINIRPNLKVVLQIGVLDKDLQALQYFKVYIQTLELVMKELDV